MNFCVCWCLDIELPDFDSYDCIPFRSKPVLNCPEILRARAGALEHELVLCAIMSKLRTSKKDIYNIVSDMAAPAGLSSGIVCSFCFYDCLLFRLKPVSTSWCFGARDGALCNYEQTKNK